MNKTSFVKRSAVVFLLPALLLGACSLEPEPEKTSAALETTVPAAKASALPAPVSTDPRSSTDADSCMADRQALLSDMVALTARYAQGCRRDEDCRAIDVRTPCQEACSLAVLGMAMDAFQGDLKLLGQRCDRLSTACGMVGMCAVVDGASCVASVCRPHLAAAQ